MGENLIIEHNNKYTSMIMNQPAKRNAVNFEMMEELEKGLKEISSNPNVRCLVITGSGTKAFCSGGDLSIFHSLHTTEEAMKMLKRMSRILYNLFTLEVPTIALLNGTAVGGGAEIAAACDFRLAMPHAKIGFVQGKLAITTGWGGTSLLLEQLPSDIVLDMVLSGSIFSACEAYQLGILRKVFKTSNQEQELATFIDQWNEVPLHVLSAYKRRKLDRINLSVLKNRMEREVEECALLWGSDLHHEAVNKFRKKKQ